MLSDHMFVITSTVNTQIGYYDSQTRFNQTLNSIRSIRTHAPNSGIVLIDNSSVPLDVAQYQTIHQMVDHFVYVGDRRICKEINKQGVRSAGEAYMLLVAFDLIKTLDSYTIKRIFKLSGRYTLSAQFRIAEYDVSAYDEKYCFRQNDSESHLCYHTRLWSFSYSMLAETVHVIQTALLMIFKNNMNIEDALFSLIDKNQVILKDKIHCQGHPALWNGIHITE
jgi:hypothetical protein